MPLANVLAPKLAWTPENFVGPLLLVLVLLEEEEEEEDADEDPNKEKPDANCGVKRTSSSISCHKLPVAASRKDGDDDDFMVGMVGMNGMNWMELDGRERVGGFRSMGSVLFRCVSCLFRSLPVDSLDLQHDR